MIGQLYDAYREWYGLLVGWAQMLVQDVTAARLARRALAFSFLQACNGVETADGPYMASCDELYRLMCLERETSGQIFVASAFSSVPVPDETLLCSIARLYAAVYEAVYVAALSLRDREQVAILIRLFDPVEIPHHKIIERLYDNCPPTHPLRCVVKAATAVPHADELICAAAGQLWQAEDDRGMSWLKSLSERKGNA